jgi:hypothetical protein
LAGWLDARLNYLAVNAGTPDPDAAGAYWAALTDGVLPRRSGPRPDVSWAIPQQQLSDNSRTDVQELLFTRLAALHHVVSGPSQISAPRALGASGFLKATVRCDSTGNWRDSAVAGSGRLKPREHGKDSTVVVDFHRQPQFCEDARDVAFDRLETEGEMSADSPI